MLIPGCRGKPILSEICAGSEIVDARSGEAIGAKSLADAAAARARDLAKEGLAAGNRAVLVPLRPLRFFIDLFAVWNVGAVAVCVSEALTARERENVAQLVQPRLWIEGEAILTPASAPPGAEGRSPAAPDAALILLTSGTSGAPKGVVHTRASLKARLELNRRYIGDRDLAVGLNLLPLHFGHGLIGNCLTVLAAGGRLILDPEPGIDGLARLGDTIDAHRVTFMSSVPSLWRVVLKTARPPQGRSLRRVHVGSAPLSAVLWKDVMDWCRIDRVCNMYGMTEAANWIAGHSAEDAPPRDGLVGRMWGGRARVRNERGELLDSGTGALEISSPALMAGYYGGPAAAGLLADGWLATEDIAELAAEGSIRLIGRHRDDINRGGTKIRCAELDLLLEGHPLVRQACAFPIADPVHGEIAGAAVVVAEQGTLDARQLRDWCAARIRREAVPDRIFLLSALPTSARGKLVRSEVRAFCLAQTAGSGRS